MKKILIFLVLTFLSTLIFSDEKTLTAERDIDQVYIQVIKNDIGSIANIRFTINLNVIKLTETTTFDYDEANFYIYSAFIKQFYTSMVSGNGYNYLRRVLIKVPKSLMIAVQADDLIEVKGKIVFLNNKNPEYIYIKDQNNPAVNKKTYPEIVIEADSIKLLPKQQK